MPIYEYRCKECHQVFEEWFKNADDDESPVCPVCDGPAERIISNTSFVLKGSGWYATDYGNRSKAAQDTPASTGEAPPAAAPSAPPPAASAPLAGASAA
ncbi:MAG: zinc ribbon domain-containing protein [Deltaproteobacteria bacterium]|nr:zinc ribbon domain-containing protein [Deltaproteobacteria bacterium]